MPTPDITQVVLRTRFGRLILAYQGDRFQAVRFGPYGQDAAPSGVRIEGNTPPGPCGRVLVEELARYFSGESVRFSTRPDVGGYTDFQRAVWKVTLAIPYGSTLTYGRIALGLGRRNGARAVGAALGRNPFPILIPCHRVIGSSGALTGFGGGIEWKRALLGLERAPTPAPSPGCGSVGVWECGRGSGA